MTVDELDVEISDEVTADEVVDVDLIGSDDELGLAITFEAPFIKPKQIRNPRPKQTPWELVLNGLREFPGEYVKFYMFTEEGHGPEYVRAARSRANTMRRRLVKQAPDQEWSVEAVEGPDGSYRVYVKYIGEASTELMTKRIEGIEAAKERGRHAAATRKAKKG